MKTKKIIALALTASLALEAFSQNFSVNASEAVLAQVESDMVFVQGGSFTMGSRDFENNESPVRTVTVNDFLMSRYEVKQNEYRNIMGINYSAFRGNDRPVEEVSWYDAVVFCNRLSIASGLTPCYSIKDETDPSEWGDVPRITDETLEESKAFWNLIECNFEADGYRLPTEAEWEYAANGGIAQEYVQYELPENADASSWYLENSLGETHEAGLLAPNALGIYDMNGNVWEWCWDWYNGRYDSTEFENPKGGTGELTGRRIRRGGSINSEARFIRNANRASSVPELRGVDLGFRVVRTVKKAVPVELSVVPAAEEYEQVVEIPAEDTVDAVESVEAPVAEDTEVFETETEGEAAEAEEAPEAPVIEVFSIIQ